MTEFEKAINKQAKTLYGIRRNRELLFLFITGKIGLGELKKQLRASEEWVSVDVVSAEYVTAVINIDAQWNSYLIKKNEERNKQLQQLYEVLKTTEWFIGKNELMRKFEALLSEVRLEP